jgi:hypothetical protein
MDAQGRARLTEILNQHDAVAQAFRESHDAFAHAMDDLRALAVLTIGTNAANRAALDGLLAANRAALALLNDEAVR